VGDAQTPSQTAGPFLHIGFAHLCRDEVIAPPDAASAVTVTGRVLDGDGAPVPDAALEIWQADTEGRYDATGARGFGRVYTDDAGRFRFITVRPGALPSVAGVVRAPHLVVTVFMRGLLKQVVTRMYFPDDARNDADAVLALVPPDRRHTLLARADVTTGVVEWDIVLQGENETVFFTW
jgi:protocatechuate 3,4-dioxygenase alpha subunit